MAKNTIRLTEAELRQIIQEKVEKILNSPSQYLNEGIDINAKDKVVTFNSDHQNNVDTNDYIHPFIIKNNVKGETVLSIFERKDNDEYKVDGNPLVYALKGIKGWRFGNPKHDLTALLRRFVSVTTNLHMHFDTLIVTPSNNQLNTTVFSYLIRLLSFDTHIETFFRKLTAEEVYENYYNQEYFDTIAHDEKELHFMRMLMDKAFQNMHKHNNGVFSYKYISPISYRDAIEQSLELLNDDISMQYNKDINGKHVIVLDDTVASGKTISDSAKAIRDSFSPTSITYLTLFSPKASQGFENQREFL